MTHWTSARSGFGLTVALLATTSVGAGESWIHFTNETDQRLLTTSPSFGTEDFQERDYAWADLNNNGWVDLVAMRKQPGTSPGARTNVLFMNEGGMLVDRTEEFASAVDLSQLPGGVNDEGFLTPTNDRDSAIADLNNNGWMDIVTAVSVSSNQPKHIGYPRIYMNQGDDGRGNWQGFIFENERIPVFESLTNNPWFSQVDAGDLTGNGYADLFFGARGQTALPLQSDPNNISRILANDGNAYFSDVSLDVVADPSWLSAAISTSVKIRDLNGNDRNDVLRVNSMGPYTVDIIYNTGTGGEPLLNQFQVAGTGAPQYANLADLNNNGRPDLIIAGAGQDQVRLNLETDASGQVTWSAPIGLPDSFGFRSNIVTADLNRNGRTDILIADMEMDLINCSNTANVADIFRNLGGTGENINFEKNAGNITGAENLRNTFDFAVFDLTGNGWPDIVQARCSNAGAGRGTTVWINRTFELCPADVNQDGQIDVFDLLDLLEDWGPCADCPTDLNGSGAVGVFDLLELLENWGSCT